MKTQVIKVILAGILGGIALFLMPFFLIRVVVFFLLISIIFRLLRPHGHHRRSFGYCHSHSQYSERWRNMSPEQRRAFKAKMEKEFFSDQDSTSANP